MHIIIYVFNSRTKIIIFCKQKDFQNQQIFASGLEFCILEVFLDRVKIICNGYVCRYVFAICLFSCMSFQFTHICVCVVLLFMRMCLMRQYMCLCTFLYVFLCPYVCTYHILLLPILVTYWDYKTWRPLFYFSCVWQIAYPSVNLIVAVSSMYLFVCRVPPSVRPSGHAFFLVVMRGLSNCPVCPSVRQSVCPLAWQSFRPFVCLSVCLFDRWMLK